MNNSSEIPEKKSFLMTFLCSGVIIPAAVLFSYASDLPLVLIISSLILAASLVMRKVLTYNDRSVIYVGLSALVLAVGGDFMLKMDPQRLGLISGLLQANMSAPFLIYLAAMSTFFRSSPSTAGLCISVALASDLLAGEIIGYKFVNKNMVLFISEIRSAPQMFFALIVSVQLLFSLMLLNLSRPVLCRSPRPMRILKYLALLCSLAIMPFMCFGAFRIYIRYENHLKQYELYFLRMGMKKRSGEARVAFDKNVNLNIPLPENIEEKLDNIVLRALALKPPGYLRGRAYSRYAGGEWSDPDENKAEELEAHHSSGALSFTTYNIDENRLRIKYDVSVYPCGNSLGNVIPVPGALSSVDIISEKLSMGVDGTLIPESWQRDGGYTCGTPEYSQFSAFNAPANPLPEKYLEVPDNIKDKIQAVLEKIPGIKKETEQNDSVVLETLTSYLLDNYTYSLRASGSKGTDPVLHFLIRSRRGHCELFASSLVMLLRQSGIPARYVTGIICDEPHPSGRYYVARLGNTHAWVEAYLRDRKCWVPAEPTPPSGIPAGRRKWGTFDSWHDFLSQILQKTLADMRRGYFAQAIIGAVTGMFSLAFDFLLDPLRGFLFLALVSLIAFYIIRRRNRKRRKAARSSPYTLMICRDFRRFEKAVFKKSGIRRLPQMPSGEWALLQPPVFGVPEVVRKYHEIRFRYSPPLHSDAAAFRKYIKERINFLKRKDIA